MSTHFTANIILPVFGVNLFYRTDIYCKNESFFFFLSPSGFPLCPPNRRKKNSLLSNNIFEPVHFRHISLSLRRSERNLPHFFVNTFSFHCIALTFIFFYVFPQFSSFNLSFFASFVT